MQVRHHLRNFSKFDKIVILPFTKDTSKRRPIPENCEVLDIPINKSRIGYVIRGLFHVKTAKPLLVEFFRNKVYSSKTKFFAWGSSARYLNNCLYNKKLKQVLQNIKKEDVAYFYWGIGQCLLSIVLKGKVHLVSRFHGEWDLWEESYGGFHSLRTDVVCCLDKAVFISKKGENYFKKRYPLSTTVVFPLGSKDWGAQKPNPMDGIVRIVSCSTVYPLKRVPLIFESLNNMTDLSVEWVHLGGGSHFNELETLVKEKKCNHLKVSLLGMMTHDEVMNYYKQHHFDLFINLSTSEGVPVSIMEAMSFDIPILATNVGSTSEEVSDQVGLLLSPNPSVNEITTSIRKILESTYTPREFWKEHYDAEKNYAAFSEMLVNL